MNGSGKVAYLILGVLLLIDLYAFRGFKQLTINFNYNLKVILGVTYWIIPLILSFLTFYITKNVGDMVGGKIFYRVFYFFMVLTVLFYVPKIIFIGFELSNDIISGFLLILNKLKLANISSNFLMLRQIGAILAIVVFSFTLYGILHGRYHYKVNKVNLSYKNLPDSFKGFRIVHITDWHIGSFNGKPKRVEQVVNRINSLNPDVILFTGDLVNNVATEVNEFIPILKKLSAKYGVYSVLGNHDYGEYVNWKNMSDSDKNLQKLKGIEQEVGFKLLNNDSEIIEINGSKIGIAGVENWGLPPFPQHGNIEKALSKIEGVGFKILMSHDPSHWDAQIKSKTNIDLTLSGHTHGMQYGIYTSKFKWSPVKFKYPKWGGLYSENGQNLFVSVGIGYIGFPGRVGMRPEIAVIELN